MLAPATVELSQLLILFLFIYTFHMKTGYWQNDIMKEMFTKQDALIIIIDKKKKNPRFLGF